MKIGIIGGGFAGLAAAHTLQKTGHDTVLYESSDNPGGLAVGYKKPQWSWTLEKHYHHFFTNDHAILQLAKSLEYPILIRRPNTSVYVDGARAQLDSPLSLLKFSRLPFHQRIRMGIVLGFLKFFPFWKPFEYFRAASVLPRLMGKEAYNLVWKPQLEGKFGSYAGQISLAWFWARVYKRTSSLAYPKGGFLSFARRLSSEIEAHGGAIHYQTQVTRVAGGKRPYIVVGGKKKYFDRVIVTLPSVPFLKIASNLPENYVEHLNRLHGIGAINLVLRLKKSFFNDSTYWLSVCERKSDILAIVEHTNFMDKKHYNEEHLVYVGRYLPASHPHFQMDARELLSVYDPFLKKINPKYRKSLIGFDKFDAPFAQPIIPPRYSEIIPPFETPLQNVYLANIQQVYPWDRGTNYAVDLGERVAQRVIEQA